MNSIAFSYLKLKMEILKNRSYIKLADKSWTSTRFEDCSFINEGTPSSLYKCRFIGCIFIRCKIFINATYCDFINCQFIDCEYGKRTERSVAYKSNFDKSTFDRVTFFKFKKCSLNGSVIGMSDNCSFIKCSDRYLTLLNVASSMKVTHADRRITRINIHKGVKES